MQIGPKLMSTRLSQYSTIAYAPVSYLLLPMTKMQSSSEQAIPI